MLSRIALLIFPLCCVLGPEWGLGQESEAEQPLASSLLTIIQSNDHDHGHHHDDGHEHPFIDLAATAPLTTQQRRDIAEQVHEAVEGPHTHGSWTLSKFMSNTINSLDFYGRYLNSRRLRNFAGDSETPTASYMKDSVFYFFVSHPLEIIGSWSVYGYGYLAGWSPESLAATAVGATAMSLPTGVTDPVCGILQACLVFPVTAKPMHAFRVFIEKYTLSPIKIRIVNFAKRMGIERVIKTVDASRFLYMIYEAQQRAKIRLHAVEDIQDEVVADIDILSQTLSPFLKFRLKRGSNERLYISDLSIVDSSLVNPLDFAWMDQLLQPLGINVRNAVRKVLLGIAKQKDEHQLEHDHLSFIEHAHHHGDKELHISFKPRSLDVPARWTFPMLSEKRSCEEAIAPNNTH